MTGSNIIIMKMLKTIVKVVPVLIMALIFGCTNRQTDKAMKQNTETVFPKGEKITNNYFTGTAWLQMLVNNDSTYNTSIGNVTFEPGARTNWHKHPGGQILLVTDGTGFYQERGKSDHIIRKGDIVKIPPDTEHWHGATPDNSLTHIAISPNNDKGSVVWLQAVTDKEYKQSTIQN